MENDPHSWRRKPRRFHSKKSTGCKTCRARRIKCDEQKPCCLKCTSTGRKCDGYDRGNTVLSTTSKCHPPIQLDANLHLTSVPLTDQESMWLQFFFLRTIPKLSEHFGGEIWLQVVSTLTLTSPSAINAAIALTIADQPSAVCGQNKSMESLRAIAIHRYNQAVQELIRPSRLPSEEAIVATCLLFSHIELRWAEWDSLSLHIRNGIALVARKSLPSALSEDILRQFASLEVQAVISNPAWVLQSTDVTVCLFAAAMATGSLEDAKAQLDDIFLRSVSYRRQCGESLTSTSQMAPADITALTAWSNTHYKLFLPIERNLDIDKRRAAGILKVQYLLSVILLSANVFGTSPPLETTWDAFSSCFESITSIVTSLLSRCESSGSSGTKSTVLLSSSTLIIPALCITGTKCRISSVRRRALDLLSLVPSDGKEGMWEAQAARLIVERVISEEARRAKLLGLDLGQVDGDPSQLPEEARISQVKITSSFEEERTATLIMRPHETVGGDEIEEVIQW